MGSERKDVTERKFAAEEGSLRIHQAIARQLGTAILMGVHKPGDLFEGEIEASERLHVSRTAYREAVRILIAKGMLESRPKAGTRVLPRSRWNVLDPEILAWMFAGEPDRDFIRDLFELRGVIEPAAAEFAARRRTDDQLAVMTRALEDMEKCGLSTPEGRAADQRFHHAILAATHNDALAALASSVGAAVSWTTTFKHRKKLLPRDPLPDHKAVYHAIAARDTAAARSTMVELLRLALADMDIALSEPLRD
ncbi:GntR family transcriptional regulator [Sphingobium sp. LB126]|uniref:FadR/GntR family transcriptional regulator n=1 Tax=Sphingobium sp. LB126 TaxID=1983755 RepID=UPI000C207AC5|nr:FadR/GntR family transcriptional regulator [Sphingobium sp. LB126]PJG47591.1 GntR family transcriptional regulator [Sphingobium sp. LB126]